MSLIQEGVPQSVRMANLACIGSRKVNGVAELHSELVRTTILKDFVEFYGISKWVMLLSVAPLLLNIRSSFVRFSNVTNGSK